MLTASFEPFIFIWLSYAFHFQGTGESKCWVICLLSIKSPTYKLISDSFCVNCYGRFLTFTFIFKKNPNIVKWSLVIMW